MKTGIPSVLRAIALLKKLPDGELLTLKNLAAKAAVTASYMHHYSSEIPQELWTWNQSPRGKIYGNAKTIKAWNSRTV